MLFRSNKSQDGSGANEKQFSGKALVVGVRHKIKPLGQTPRYTCIVRVVKAGYDQGGGKSDSDTGGGGII